VLTAITVIRYGSVETTAPLFWVLTCVGHYEMVMVPESLANLLDQTTEILLALASYMHPGRRKDFPVDICNYMVYAVYRFPTLPPNGVL